MSLAQRLRHFAESSGMKIKDLAEKAKMEPPQLQKYLRGTSPSVETLERFGEIGVNIHWLVTGEGAMYAENEAGQEAKRKRQALGLEHEPEIIGNLASAEISKTIFIHPEEVEQLETLLNNLKRRQS